MQHWAGISTCRQSAPFNEWLLKVVDPLLPGNIRMHIIHVDKLPPYSDEKCTGDKEVIPVSVVSLRKDLCTADGLVIVSPEYKYDQPGGLKNAMDWACAEDETALSEKPVALLGTTPDFWGTVRIQKAFKTFFEQLEVQPVYSMESQAMEKFDKKGNLKDGKIRECIIRKLRSLRDLTAKCKVD